MLANKLLGAAKAATAAANYVEDVFSTYLYTGNGSAQTINNGIALGDDYGGSAYFDGGASTALTCSSTTAFDFGTGDFTVECWAYISSQVGSFTIICATEGVNQYWGFGSVGSGGMTMYAGSSGTDIYSGTANTPALNQWNHLVWQRSSGVASMYLNGTRVYNAAYTADFGSAATGFRIGQSTNYANYYATGYISNLRVVKGTGVYSGSTITVPTSPLTAITNTQLLTCQSPSATTDYSSNAFTITVTNAIAQNGGGPFTDSTANKGGLVWIKSRSNAYNNNVFDSLRGSGQYLLETNSTSAQGTNTFNVTSLNSNGFSIGTGSQVNASAATYASWTFRKQAKFFDVVTYTGNGSNRTISHNLGSVPGCIIIKRTDTTGNWQVYHRGLTSAANSIQLNLGNAQASATTVWNSTAPTSTVFSVGTDSTVNANGGTYVAYIFAHNDGGFGASGTDNVITCGTYLGSNHRAKEIVTLGYEPQWVMVKNISSAANSWVMTDIMRNMSSSATDPQRWLLANSSAVESTATTDQVVAASTGFYFNSVQSDINEAGSTFIYIAIRRPMKTPTSGTSVFSPVTFSFDSFTTAGFPVDFLLSKQITSTNTWRALDRLRGSPPPSLSTSAAAAEVAEGYWKLDNSTGVNNVVGSSISGYENWMFRRSSGFFDVVCDTGTGSAHTITHGLTVAPELMIRKKRNSATNSDWAVWHTLFSGTTKYLFLNTNGAEATASTVWTSTSPTSTVFSVGTSATVNNTSDTFVTYLFATVAGVSKVGSYTGAGTTQTINCGFTAGARFVMIKRTDSTGDWYVWDTARGIVSGNDSYLRLNSDAAQDATTDYIDPANSGFEISSTAPAAINANGGTFIFLAIA